MIDKNYNIPLVYQKMNERGYTNTQNDLYLCCTPLSLTYN